MPAAGDAAADGPRAADARHEPGRRARAQGRTRTSAPARSPTARRCWSTACGTRKATPASRAHGLSAVGDPGVQGVLSQSPAEYGWTAGGAVSMATKSGSNQFHGEAFEFYRNKAPQRDGSVRRRRPGQPKPNFSRHQYGGAIGGPIIKDKLHFFEAAEALQSNLHDTVVVRSRRSSTGT